MADVIPYITAPLVWEHDGHTFRAVVDVLPDLADWPAHQPGCCQPLCPATVHGRDPAGCALRLTGTCTDRRCSPVRFDQAGTLKETTPVSDHWRLDEWTALLASPDGCFIAGCDNDEIDQRGPVFLRGSSMHKACMEHWAVIFRVLGEQASWERTDAMRSGQQSPVRRHG